MAYLKRKIDRVLINWKNRPHLPLLISGARQVGKTESILYFGRTNYESLVYVNFALDKEYRTLASSDYRPDSILSEISLINPEARFIPGKTLIVFDEIQEHPDIVTSLKFFKIDGRFDVIVSGSLLGVQLKRIHSLPVGYLEEYRMHSLDFEEFLWAMGRKDDFVEMIYAGMLALKPYNSLELSTFSRHFLDFCITGGMPAVVALLVQQRNFSGIEEIKHKILSLHRDDARKYCEGLDSARIVEVYDSVPAQLSKENKKFQLSKIAKGQRARDYSGCLQWLEDAGLVTRARCQANLEFPLKGNHRPDTFKIYYPDTGLLLSCLDSESALDFKVHRKYFSYKGGIAENMVGEALMKAGKDLFYYRREDSKLELDFLLRTVDTMVPLEVKASNGNSKSLRTVIDSSNYPLVRFGVKFVDGNIGFENSIYTFPHFCAFLLSRFLEEKYGLKEARDDGGEIL